jgi:hypothetical protein
MKLLSSFEWLNSRRSVLGCSLPEFRSFLAAHLPAMLILHHKLAKSVTVLRVKGDEGASFWTT